MKNKYLVVLLGLTTIVNAQKKILITGGAGFIGSHVAQALLERGDRVIIVDNLNDYYPLALKRSNLASVKRNGQQEFSFYQVDICDSVQLQTIFEQERPEIICHLAARAGVRPSIESPDLYVQSNVAGTVNVLQMAHQYAVPHVVIASSSSVYGAQSKQPFEEDDVCCAPVSHYAATKRACELLAYTYHHLYGFSVSCLRFFTVYGPRGRIDMAPFKFIDAVHNGTTIFQYGDGSAVRDFTYIDDIVAGVLKAIDIPCGFEIFNLGRGEPILLRDFIATIEQVVGKQASVEIVDPVPGDVPCTFASIKKARKMLGYEPKVSIYDGLQKMYVWYKSLGCN